MENDKLHMRHVMLYEFKKGVSVGTAAKNIAHVYKDRAPALRTVKKWFGRFRNGDFNLDDQFRSGRPSGVDNDCIRDLVDGNPNISTEEIAEKLNVDKSTAFRHLKKLGYVSKLDSWVPQNSTTERNKLKRASTDDPLADFEYEEYEKSEKCLKNEQDAQCEQSESLLDQVMTGDTSKSIVISGRDAVKKKVLKQPKKEEEDSDEEEDTVLKQEHRERYKADAKSNAAEKGQLVTGDSKKSGKK